MMMSRIQRQRLQRSTTTPDALDLLIRASCAEAAAVVRETVPQEWLDLLAAALPPSHH